MRPALLLLLALAACHSGPSIESFTADKSSIDEGEPVNFSWRVSGATRLSIDPDVGDVTGSTTAQAHPFASATYTLTATGSSGTSKARLDIAVKPAPGAAFFVATPAQVAPGAAARLQWSVEGATSVSISGVSGQLPPAGSLSLDSGVDKTTRYTLTAAPLAAPLSALLRVSPAPVITSFTAPPAAQQGADVTLSWTATNATSFTLTSDAGLSRFLGPLTSFTLPQAQTATYTLTAKGPTGSATQTATVTVAQTPGSRFLYTPPSSGGEAVRLLADSCAAASCTLSLVVAKPVTADALALDLPVPGAARVALHQASAAPDWQVNPNGDALDPGASPPAAAVALPSSGPLARVLTLGIAQKPASGGPRQLQPGAVLARFTLDLVPSGGAGLVFSPAQAPSFVLRSGATPQGTLAIGTLRVQ